MDHPASIRFQGWEIRPVERRLLVKGQIVSIGHRAFEVLLALVAEAGRIVSKDRLLSIAWPGLVVEENNVSVQIAALRKVLGNGVITTVPGVGYRLSSAIEQRASTPRSNRADDGPSTSNLAIEASSGAGIGALIGRDDDVEALTELLADHALVSIVGTGGVGKTSVAHAVAACDGPKRRRDVHWVDLAPLKDVSQIAATLGKVLGIDIKGFVDPIDAVMAALASVRALVVLDNCEHLSASVAAIVARALGEARGVRWLATSQEPLHVSVEVVYRLQPLSIPQADATLQEASKGTALALLCRRAEAADRHFALTAANLHLAIDLCRQLDGLPLAIEMAAARIATLGLDLVHRQIGQRLSLLSGPRHGPQRHHTLRSTFDWSFRMLSPAEQKVFRRLHPFVDGFSVAMVHEVARDVDDASSSWEEWQTADVLSALVDKSLVHRNAALPGRFFLFESARDYAGKRLAEAGEWDKIRRRHAQVVAGWFDRSETDLARLRDDEWLALYAPERHNTFAAIAWASDAGEPETLAALIAALARVGLLSYSTAEIVQLEIPLAVLYDASPPLRSAACLVLGWVHYLDGNPELGIDLSLRALDDFRAAGDIGGCYRALAHLVRQYEARVGKRAEAQQCWDEFREIDDRDLPLRTRLTSAIWACPQFAPEYNIDRWRELAEMASRSGFDSLVGICRAHVTDALLIAERYEAVVEAAETYLEAGESRPRARSLILRNQALALVRLGRSREAVVPARNALRAYPNGTHIIANTFALAAAQEGLYVDAAILSGHAQGARRERLNNLDLAEMAAMRETDSLLAAAFDASRLAELIQAGAAMTAGEIVRLMARGNHEVESSG